ncbi:site-specific DNA-methyltransferase [Chryseobacterium sp. TY3]
MSNYENLQKVLKEIFEMDKADLDFGIYRIMNQKRDQVMDFIDSRLPKDIKDILAQTQSKDSASIQAELDQIGKSLDDAGVARESAPKYIALKAQLENVIDTNALEQEVFSHLANFFKRYYKDGDFISLRRYKKDVYAIPYEGEEVKLHWANHDQYYIKTSEYLKNYSFKLKDGKSVHFQLKEASTEQNNNKSQGDQERRFAIDEKQPVEVIDGQLYINFTYEPHKKTVKQADLEAKAIEVIQNNIPAEFALAFDKAPTEKNKNRTILEKHLNDFISRNSFDYFIHKDLGGFLRRELDFYIKNEVLYIDDINTENPAFFTAQLSKIKALKTVASKIITFLAQIEDFQKKLWLKKKFVISTHYCITLDRIPSTYYAEIVANQAQLDEWKELFDVAVSSVEQISFEQFLVLDTKHFSEEFKDKLLAEFDNLDEETNGLLINSENFQALNLMQEKYQEKITSIYIDPPYNTEGDGFSYKDSFKHSSWLSLIYDRVLISKNLVLNQGNFFASIDNREQENLKILLNSIFEASNFAETFLWTKTSTPPALSYKSRKTVEYIHCFEKEFNNIEYCGDLLNNGDAPLLNSGNADKEIIFPPKSIKFNIPDGIYDLSKPDKVELITKVIVENSFNSNEVILKGPFKWKQETVYDEINKGTYFIVKTDRFSVRFQRIDSGQYKAPNNKITLELNKDSGVDTNEGATKELANLGLSNFSFPKPSTLVSKLVSFNRLLSNKPIILDYFAGSGTTGHATIKLNREDGGNRKYILVEMGTYFNTVTKPRIQKVIYTDNWKNGKPQDKVGISQIFKYQVLESYEDALNNLQLPNKTNAALLNFEEQAQEEYLLNYMLDVETQDHLFNVQMFRNPFNYQLKVTENNELVPTKVDLVETFNYLIGLYVERVQRVGDIKFVEGKTREGIKTLVIWRNLETTTHEETAQRFRKIYDSVRSSEFDQIYINGDHHFDNMRTGEDTFKVKLIEETFFKQMFNISEL